MSMTEPFWPRGRKAAVAFTFDVDGESPWLAADPANATRPVLLSQGAYGPRVGLPLILDSLASFDVRGTFFVPGVVADGRPEIVEDILARGHEIGLHGYTHAHPHALPVEAEREELERAYATLSAGRAAITGYRAPGWDISESTLGLLEEKGLLYSSQFMDDFRPYRHAGRRLIELPVHWVLDDWPHFGWHEGVSTKPIRSVRDVEGLWKEELDGICGHGGLCVLTMHPQLSGRPSRVRLLEEMIRYVQADPEIWIATCVEIARHVDETLAGTGA